MVQEYRRTCSRCGKVWHSLVAREKQIDTAKTQAAFATLGSCCGDNSQNMRNIEAGNEDLNRLRQCPDCKSSSYTEEILDE